MYYTSCLYCTTEAFVFPKMVVKITLDANVCDYKTEKHYWAVIHSYKLQAIWIIMVFNHQNQKTFSFNFS